MPKRCFVIQGFGKKQDYVQGKLFNLDASYQVIKEAIQEVGLDCYRADELRTNAVIDQVMYDQLLSADLVIADITTLNFNAAYELGVRYALRPYSTLVVGEKGMNFPFDVNHIAGNSDAVIKTELHAVARYVRRKVKDICNKALQEENLKGDEKYWVLATLYEACVGLDDEEALHWKVEMAKLDSPDWMLKTTEDQITRLRTLLS